MLLYSLTLPFHIVLYASLLIVIGTYQFDRKDFKHQECLKYIVLSLVFGVFVGFGVKMMALSCDKSLGVVTRNQRDILIGNGGMVLFGVVFLWITYRYGMDRPTLISSSIATNLLSLFFWLLFILTPSRDNLIRLFDHVKYRKIQQIGATIYFLIFMFVLSLVTNRDVKNLDRRILLFHLLFFFCSYGISIIDILVVWTGGIVLSPKGLDLEAKVNLPQSPRKQPDEPNEEKVSDDQEPPLDSLECEICGNGYSNNRLPLIIKACGHTVCENCIDILQEKSDWNCPSCRQFSNVPVNDLPVNQSILDYILDRDRFDALACIQCNFRFNEEREPLVLRECGHSICQSCITTLGKNGFIVCMPCRKISFLSDAKTGQLPKNYAVLSVIRELDK